MANVTRGFSGRKRSPSAELPPGQHLTDGFPVLSAGPTPRISRDTWELSVRAGDAVNRSWSWPELMELPSSTINTDIHCVTSWSKLGTHWRGVSMDLLLADVGPEWGYLMAHSYGGYTTNLAVDDLRDGKAWIAYEYDGADLPAEHGGPARLLVPHLYLWKSAKWIRGFVAATEDRPGFWEQNGYHMRGDPWQEQRYSRWW
ncbi:MAG TPA: molybdopterin-dependent oxidoreductase [Microlunatus sp.]